MTAMKAARADFQEARQSVAGIGEQVKKLAETRNAALKTAMDAFKKEVSAAKADLLAAFGTTEVPEAETGSVAEPAE